ncbi:hypothetical protein [Bradyrhizobium sp. 195]|uniref:hypothetical protein n=1 Tax=Bradyrhizobium sp. 195 TaxID=2782662 RepID=UPI002001A815|nr:hypothetical protein [Bradyrhizobium sp. 195]UPK30836.1 hypothetical protein IVB26_17900 [Bradyrhizobium sp. 195]
MMGSDDGPAAGIYFPWAHLDVHCARNVRPGIVHVCAVESNGKMAPARKARRAGRLAPAAVQGTFRISCLSRAATGAGRALGRPAQLLSSGILRVFLTVYRQSLRSHLSDINDAFSI